jgi:cytochrome c biogenesis protein CcmG, thiol:disulfide interchange protein DsbE
MKDRRALIGAAAMAVLVLVVAAFGPVSEPATDTAASAIDVPFEYVDGTVGNLSDFAGTPVVVNFWASWCPACVAEMPDFEEVHAALGDEVVFLGLNMQETDPAAAERLVAATGVSYQLGVDPDGSIFNRFGGIAMPTTVFIGADGAVVTTHSGVIFADDLDVLIRSELLSS